MTEQEKAWFDEIAQHRQRAWDDVFSDSAFIGVMHGVVEKYAGLGHFVYELLQNADDAVAKTAHFELLDDRLVFRHDGTERFTVTSRASEKDGHSVRGHFNSLTSIGASEKIRQKNLGNVIGKFGVGFKAVFQYTNRPEIYDDNMSFALEHYIVPKLIDTDYPGRKSGETVFVFPFDRKDKPNAREEIWQALQSLVFPTLFLNHLKQVRYCSGELCGEYRIDCSFRVDNVGPNAMTVQKTDVIACSPAGEKRTPLWLFTMECEKHRCSVGYAVNESGEVIPADYFAFCFFPTRHQTKLKFIIHAPFLLNDSREGILSGSAHNEQMIEQLAVLAADGLKYLCDKADSDKVSSVTDDIVKVLPISREDYGDGISFDPFRIQFEHLFEVARVIPAKAHYIDRAHAYWPESIAVPQLFSDEQLQELYGVEEIRWAFPTIPRENKSRNVGKELTSDVFDFIENCTSECVYDNNIIGRLSALFIEHQPMAWLEKLYDWIADNKDRVNKARTAPIFFNQHGKACAVCGVEGGVRLYLPVEGEDRYDMVRSDLLQNEHAKRLLEKYKLKEPNKRDWVQVILSKKLPTARAAEIDGLLSQVMTYYVSCGEEERSQIAGQLGQIPCWKTIDEDTTPHSARELYLESNDIREYFDEIGGARYVDVRRYLKMVDAQYEKDVLTLLKKVGVASLPRFEHTEMPRNEVFGFYITNRVKYEFPHSTGKMTFVVSRIDGLEAYLKSLLSAPTLELRKRKSLFLWKLLGDIATAKAIEDGAGNVAEYFRRFMLGTYRYFYYQSRYQSFESPQFESLKNSAWLVNIDGQMVAPKDVAGDKLNSEYAKLQDFGMVLAMLNVAESTAVSNETTGEQQARAALSETAKDALSLGEFASRLGLTKEELEEFAREKKAHKGSRPPVIDAPVVGSGESAGANGDGSKGIDSPTDPFASANKAIRDAAEKTKAYHEKHRKTDEENSSTTRPVLPKVDSDPMQPKTVDFEKRAEELRKKVEEQIDQMKVEAELQSTAVEAKEYSYAWLKSRLELEMRASGADDEKHREATVSFRKMEREPGTDNMFMLSAASDAIPQWFEEEVNQRLTIRIPGRPDIETVIESMSVMSFRLKAKVRILPGMDKIDWSQVVEAKTVATKPTFLLNALKEGYETLRLSDDFNFKENLPDDLRFVFGPPGTGKTTHLARKVLIPLARETAHPHVLVLTPTNKAADVLTKRIIEECGEDASYKEWLTRFGITLDGDLQGSPVARAKDVQIDDGHSAVVVTTVIRFAYDAFTSMDKSKLADFKWDYVVIDEASMIPLMQILYPIFKAKGANFVIAGDPMQIAPVVMSDLSVGQNIYTMVNLQDFAHPTTEPRQYEVVCLDEQYRSVPCIGRIFSEFAYGGKLRHHRSADEESVLDLGIEGMEPVKPLTVLRYPVSRFESIFKIKLLGMSSYQIYSALFVFEYICKLAEGLHRTGRKGFRIGVISPYRAQADIVDRLIAKLDSMQLEGVEVHVGTVHSFQGDECEMIIAILNPPQGMGRREGSFINDKKILNVAISRARDYLVVAIPDERTPNVRYLSGPLAIVGLMRKNAVGFGEIQTPDLEETAWGDRDYIEKNTYSTGHQSVNVYETPEKRFEVRSDDAALDVHFRSDRSIVAPGDGFVSERERIEVEMTAEEQARKSFVVPTGFHKPSYGERVPVMKQYYLIGRNEPLECENELEDIDPSQVLAIED